MSLSTTYPFTARVQVFNRVVIPSAIIEAEDIKPGDFVELELKNKRRIVSK